MNRNYRFNSDYSNKFGYYVQLNPYLRCDDDTPLADYKDLSIPEIQGIARDENCYGTVLSPCSQRREPHRRYHADLINTCKRYRLDLNHHHLEFEYVRYFRDRCRSYPSYGVKIDRRRYLLISV